MSLDERVQAHGKVWLLKIWHFHTFEYFTRSIFPCSILWLSIMKPGYYGKQSLSWISVGVKSELSWLSDVREIQDFEIFICCMARPSSLRLLRSLRVGLRQLATLASRGTSLRFASLLRVGHYRDGISYWSRFGHFRYQKSSELAREGWRGTAWPTWVICMPKKKAEP